jgi:hypothetical protein
MMYDTSHLNCHELNAKNRKTVVSVSRVAQPHHIGPSSLAGKVLHKDIQPGETMYYSLFTHLCDDTSNQNSCGWDTVIWDTMITFGWSGPRRLVTPRHTWGNDEYVSCFSG